MGEEKSLATVCRLTLGRASGHGAAGEGVG
jgi:hypothetical protein